jgi:Fe-S oxidoreductase
LEIYGDPWGGGPAIRNDWVRGLNIKTVQTSIDFDLLYWVGCAGAFDSRSQQTAISMVKILQKAGINFGILGSEETCCGDFARRTGNEYLFQVLAKKNIETLHKYNIRKILVACPHGYNTFKNEYPLLGGNFEVVHAVEFIFTLIKEDKLILSKELSKKLVYHDPCYLGRHNGMVDLPRRVLSSIKGVTLNESEKNKDKSFCCGGGGGHFWMESSGLRINNRRIEQLLENSPDMIATGCPYCLIMLEDGLESKEMKGLVLVKDIIEVVSQVL